MALVAAYAVGPDTEVAVVDGGAPDRAWVGRARVTVHAPAADLRSPMTLGRRWWVVRADGGEEESAEHNTARFRWLLRERGVALEGPPPRELVAEVPAEALRAEALGLARAWAEDLEDGRTLHPTREWCGLLRVAAHADVLDDDAAYAWAVDEVGEGVLGGPDEPPARAVAWEVARLAGTWALERRGEGR